MKAINCPICHKSSKLDSHAVYKPFCSERCKMIDLGSWMDGTYSIDEATVYDEGDLIEAEIKKH